MRKFIINWKIILYVLKLYSVHFVHCLKKFYFYFFIKIHLNFSTVLLESKDKKKVALPKSSIVKKTSIVNPTSSRHYKSAIPSSGPSFSGPGRGGGQARPSGPRPPSPDHAFSRQSELKKCHTFTSSKPSSNSEISKRPIRWEKILLPKKLLKK